MSNTNPTPEQLDIVVGDLTHWEPDTPVEAYLVAAGQEVIKHMRVLEARARRNAALAAVAVSLAVIATARATVRATP